MPERKDKNQKTKLYGTEMDSAQDKLDSLTMLTFGLGGSFGSVGKKGLKKGVEAAEDIVDAFQDATSILKLFKKLNDQKLDSKYSPFELPDKTGVFVGPPPIQPAIRPMHPGPDSNGPLDSVPRIMDENPMAILGGWPYPGRRSRGKQTTLGDFISILLSGSSLPGIFGDLLEILLGGDSRRNPFGDILSIFTGKGDAASGIGGLFGGLFDGGFIGIVEEIDQTEQRYREMIETIIGGNKEASDSIAGMFDQLVGGGEEAAALTGEAFETMGGQIYDLVGEYATKLGTLSLLSSKVFAALRSMNPWVASAAGVALIALGQAMRSLAGSVGTGRIGGPEASSVGTGSGTPAAGSEPVGSERPRTQIIIIDSSGRKLAGSYDLDRTFDRAGIDRGLRRQIRELVRSGSLTLAD